MSIVSNRVRAARAASWIVALGTAITGLVLLLNRTVVLWEPAYEAEYDWQSVPIDVVGIGLALLCTGVLALLGVLICEGFGWAQSPAVEPDEEWAP
jgi:uncharacterized membrane protein YhaH (DUF805 family)